MPMAEIYQNAFIILAAGDSTDAHGGFFRKLPVYYAEPWCLTYAQDGKEYQIYIRLLISHLTKCRLRCPHCGNEDGYSRNAFCPNVFYASRSLKYSGNVLRTRLAPAEQRMMVLITYQKRTM
jgi:hypothetical protein